MSSAVGLRDQRLALYSRTDQGVDGLARAVFSFTVTRWGRLDDTSATVQAMQNRLQMKLDAVANFADEVEVPTGGIIRDTVDGRAWWVRGIYSTRLLRRVVVGLERISDEQFRTFEVFDGSSSLDGTHLVTPGDAPVAGT